jgi:hypothetical protein
MTSRFKVSAPKPVDEKALAAFAAGADSRAPAVAVAPGADEKATLGFNLRLTPSQMELINWVFERSTHKSKQKLIESILFPELERRRHELQERERAA